MEDMELFSRERCGFCEVPQTHMQGCAVYKNLRRERYLNRALWIATGLLLWWKLF